MNYMSPTEISIHLNEFKPRPYQLPIFDALENKGYRRVLAILPRRAGKDVCGFNVMLRAALRVVGVYYYIFPEYSQGKKVIWDSITNDGRRFLDYIPREIVQSTNSQELKISLTNGSIIQIVGSNNYDSIMGTNPRGVIFSEYALQDPMAYRYIRPILTANDGWALFLSTPRGKNHLWDLYKIALESDNWFCLKLTLDDTKHVSKEDIEEERNEGIMSEDLIQQEYYTSFEMGVEGAYYAKYIDRMRVAGQIGNVPWENSFPVHTAWDIGVRDSTTILFFQQIGMTIRIIDVYEKAKEGLEHYANVLQSKPYKYGKHIAPHDIAVQEWGSGLRRIDKARHLGIKFILTPSGLSIDDGIEAVRSNLPKIWIDSNKCSTFIKSIENYRQEFDIKKRVYKGTPLHDWSSHFADALRYLCISLPKVQDGLTAELKEKRYREAVYGEQSNMPSVFRDDLPPY